jgi:hypothetical protein
LRFGDEESVHEVVAGRSIKRTSIYKLIAKKEEETEAYRYVCKYLNLLEEEERRA